MGGKWESGCLRDGKQTGHPGSSAKRVIRELDAFVRSSKKSIRQASTELHILGNRFDILYERICK